MPFQIQGNGGTVAEVGGTTFRALRVEQRPIDYGALGTYRKSLLSGTMAAGLAANANVFRFRWTSATNVCAIRNVIIDGMGGSATAFTAGFASFRLFPARNFSASGSGGTAGTLTGNNGKMRTSMATMSVGDVRISSTAALTAGTWTLDTDPIAQYGYTIGTAVSTQYLGATPLFGEDVGPEHPLVLAQNEGFTLQATVPATGTWQFGVTVIWNELSAY